MAIGRRAQNHVEEETSGVQDQWKCQLPMEVKSVKESLLRLIPVIQILARSTVNGDLMANGLHAQNHVEEEKSRVQDQWRCQLQMEVESVKVSLHRLILVIPIHAQSTVNAAHMAIGRHAQKHVEEEKSHVQDHWQY